jgi:putative flippase GtrA
MESLLLPKPQPTRGEQRATRTTPATPAKAAPAAPGPFGSFVRFVVCGGGVGILSSAAVPLVAALMPWALANALITVASTLLCTELHALFTFGTGRRAGWRRHLQSAGSATAAYVVTCAAVFTLHAVVASPGMLWEQTVYLSAAGLAGVGRFLVLRLFVFAGRRDGVEAARPTVVCPDLHHPGRPLRPHRRRRPPLGEEEQGRAVLHPDLRLLGQPDRGPLRTAAPVHPGQLHPPQPPRADSGPAPLPALAQRRRPPPRRTRRPTQGTHPHPQREGRPLGRRPPSRSLSTRRTEVAAAPGRISQG